MRGWKDILLRVKQQVSEDNLDFVAAGMAFYALLAIGPALAAVVAIYGLFAEPADVHDLLGQVLGLAPTAGRQVSAELLGRAVAEAPTSLTFRAVGSILLSVWSANRGMKALIIGVNIAYDEQGQKRGFIRENLVSLTFMLAAVIGFVIAAFCVVALPHLLRASYVTAWLAWILSILRWPLLFLLFLLAIAALYRWGPVRRPPRWRWVSLGSVVATIGWLLASALLSLYSTYISDLESGYGPIGGFVALLLWFYASAFVVLLGAELNAEIEHQTAEDTTVGEPKPLGERGAYVADTIGEPAT